MTGKHVVEECIELRGFLPREVEEDPQGTRRGREGGREKEEDKLESFFYHIYEFRILASSSID